MSLKQLIEFVQDFGYIDVDQRIVGGPKWLGSAKFDIEARCDEETAHAFGRMPVKQQIRAEQNMIQALLADRFKLRTHHEMRRLAVYALVQAKSGSKVAAGLLQRVRREAVGQVLDAKLQDLLKRLREYPGVAALTCRGFDLPRICAFRKREHLMFCWCPAAMGSRR
jgi:uncharacterized protein (TIGR03435 family)